VWLDTRAEHAVSGRLLVPATGRLLREHLKTRRGWYQIHDDDRPATAPLVVRAGATVLVAGSAIFGDREGVTAAMVRLQTVILHPEDEREPAESSR
jgi:pentose-5-phosphate-3-epimerase